MAVAVTVAGPVLDFEPVLALGPEPEAALEAPVPLVGSESEMAVLAVLVVLVVALVLVLVLVLVVFVELPIAKIAGISCAAAWPMSGASAPCASASSKAYRLQPKPSAVPFGSR